MTIILMLHIFLMSGSLLATAVMALMAAVSHGVDPRFVRLNLFGTIAGVLCGISLIARNPLDIKCAVLFAYVLAFGVVYAYVRRQNQRLARSES